MKSVLTNVKKDLYKGNVHKHTTLKASYSIGPRNKEIEKSTKQKLYKISMKTKRLAVHL